MADVFISYASGNRSCAHLLSEVLAAQGWTVWWDREIPVGQTYYSVIANALGSARSITVIWSFDAVASDWVIEEADEGRKRKALFPVKIDAAAIPPGFRTIQAADLIGWNGELEHQGLQAFLQSIGKYLGGPRATPVDEALRLISRFCQQRKVLIEEIAFNGISSSGAQFVSAKARDKMGYVYCHTSGRHLGEVYYVRKGISIYYHEHLRGPNSELGLPISNEELVDATHFPTSFFENGYIDWSPLTWEARAFLLTAHGELPLGRPAVV